MIRLVLDSYHVAKHQVIANVCVQEAAAREREALALRKVEEDQAKMA